MKITDPDGNNIAYAYNTGGLCTSMVTSADSQTTTITYDSLRRRSTVTYPTTTNVVTTYTYDNLDRIMKISSVAGATTYDLEYTYVTNKDLISQQVIKLNAVAVSTIDLTYDSTGRVTEEKVTKAGPTVTYDKQYTYDKVSRRLTVKDVTNGNWLETSTFDSSGRLTRITVTSGTGSNPFSWPKGTTNVTCDANGNIIQLVGRNVDTGAIWKVAHQFDYEQRVTLILLNSGDTVQNIYDGMGYRLKETTTSGGTATPKNLVPVLGNRVIQERDGSDSVTTRYYWDGGVFFKKDHSTSSKYFVPEIANSPFTGWNNAGTFNRYDLWDSFGMKEDQSASGSLSPFQLFANILVNATHLTNSRRNKSLYPEIGREVGGLFSLLFIDCPPCSPGASCSFAAECPSGKACCLCGPPPCDFVEMAKSCALFCNSTGPGPSGGGPGVPIGGGASGCPGRKIVACLAIMITGSTVSNAFEICMTHANESFALRLKVCAALLAICVAGTFLTGPIGVAACFAVAAGCVLNANCQHAIDVNACICAACYPTGPLPPECGGAGGGGGGGAGSGGGGGPTGGCQYCPL